MITKKELEFQATSLAKMAGLNTPEEIGTAVIFFNRHTGDLAMRAVKMDRGQMKQILEALFKGYGIQVITEGVDA